MKAHIRTDVLSEQLITWILSVAKSVQIVFAVIVFQ